MIAKLGVGVVVALLDASENPPIWQKVLFFRRKYSDIKSVLGDGSTELSVALHRILHGTTLLRILT